VPDPAGIPVHIIRSAKRKRTISGELQNGTLVIRAPARLSDAELAPHIESLRKKLTRRAKRRRAPASDTELDALAQKLNREYFGGGLAWQSIRYVSNQNKRYGSCTPSTGEIRISDRLQAMPKWVLEYIIVHELAHLQEANHGAAFWALVNRYPKTERAQGYLMAMGIEEETVGRET
jgi:hypothetical protein